MTTLSAGVQREDIDYYQGTARTVTVPVLDGATPPVPVPGPTTGWVAKAEVRRRADAPVLHTFQPAADPDPPVGTWSDIDITATGTAPGVLVVHLTFDPTVTVLWTWTCARYDVRLTPPSGGPDVLITGYIRITPRITQ